MVYDRPYYTLDGTAYDRNPTTVRTSRMLAKTFLVRLRESTGMEPRYLDWLRNNAGRAADDNDFEGMCRQILLESDVEEVTARLEG